MAEITHNGNPIHTVGELPTVGTLAPDFQLTGSDLVDVSLSDYRGKKVILNIFISIDTGICAASTHRFNQEVSRQENTVVLCISKDLPFAHKRFCGAEGLNDVIPLSEVRTAKFGIDYGVAIKDGLLAGLFSRAVVVLDEKGTVLYTEQVPEIAQEPDYESALAIL